MLLDCLLNPLPFRSGVRLLLFFLIGAIVNAFCFIKFFSHPIISAFCFCIAFYCFFKKTTLLQYPQSNNLDLLEYLFLGSLILYWCIQNPYIRKILECRILVAFGKISFAFYAIHMVVFGSFTLIALQHFNIYLTLVLSFGLSCFFSYFLTKIDLFLINRLNVYIQQLLKINQ